MAVAQLAVGGCPPREFQCVLQPELWLGQWSCVSSSDICARLPSVRVGTALSGWASPCSAHPLHGFLLVLPSLGPIALSSFLFSDQIWGLEQLVSSDTTPKWIKALCGRGEQAKKKTLNKTKPGVWAFLQVFPLSLLRLFLEQVVI